MDRYAIVLARALRLGLALLASMPGMAQATPVLSDADRAFIGWDSQIERAQQNMGDIAQRRGRSSSLREFGRRLQLDHAAAYSRLRAIAEANGEGRDQPLGAVHLKVERRYDTMPAAGFDQQFARHEVQDHRNFLRHFRNEAVKGSNRDLRAYATRQIPLLELDLREAEAMAFGAGSGR